jgi:phosphoglycerate dehydrogenase-like enzyme
VLDDVDHIAAGLDQWDRLGKVDVAFHPDRAGDDDELVEWLSYAEVVVTVDERTILTADLLERLPAIQVVITHGPNRAVDLEAATELGITVCAAEPPDRISLDHNRTFEEYQAYFGRAIDIIESFRAGTVILARN